MLLAVVPKGKHQDEGMQAVLESWNEEIVAAGGEDRIWTTLKEWRHVAGRYEKHVRTCFSSWSVARRLMPADDAVDLAKAFPFTDRQAREFVQARNAAGKRGVTIDQYKEFLAARDEDKSLTVERHFTIGTPPIMLILGRVRDGLHDLKKARMSDPKTYAALERGYDRDTLSEVRDLCISEARAIEQHLPALSQTRRSA
jgi:hypothetical protein